MEEKCLSCNIEPCECDVCPWDNVQGTDGEL
jgi:hypothetical protein